VELAASDDGKTFKVVSVKDIDADARQNNAVETLRFEALHLNTRYLRLTAKTYGVIPPGKPGEGNGAWLFLDEIVVD
jgi:hexosaminidase